MKSAVRFIAILGSVVLLSACISFGPEPQEVVTYVLHAPPCDGAESAGSRTGSTGDAYRLWLVPASARQLIYSSKILFAPDPYRRGHYQYATWAEPPPERLTLLLENRLACEGLFSLISTRTVPSDLILYTEIIELYHDSTTAPGREVVRVRAELVDGESGNLIGGREFERETELESFDARGAVEAASRAVAEIIDEIVAWLRESVEERKVGETKGREPQA